MTTPPIMSVTDELIAELEIEAQAAYELGYFATMTPAELRALLSERAELKQQVADFEEACKGVASNPRIVLMLTDENDSLRAENAELKLDAEKWRAANAD